jgi:hypothetical protein
MKARMNMTLKSLSVLLVLGFLWFAAQGIGG